MHIKYDVNNWNQKRIDRSKEKIYLINLKKEIAENIKHNRNLVIDRMDGKLEGLKLAKEFCEDDLDILDTLDMLNKISYGGVFGGGFPLGIKNYYDELLNTGNLQLIKSDSIKNMVAEYYTRIEYQTMRMQTYATPYANYCDALRPFRRDDPAFISKYDQLEMIHAFKTDEFRKMVDAELSYADAIYHAVRSLERRAGIIIELIDKELASD